MVTLGGAGVRSDPTTPPALSLDSKLALLRRRRRLSFLKRYAAIGPVVVGLSLLLLAAYAGMASLH